MTAFLTATFTALFGVIWYVLGQITVKLFEPAYDLRAHFGAIARDLLLYANRDPKIASDQERLEIFRKLAGATHEKLYRVAWYWVFETILELPPRVDVEKAASFLVGLSNAQLATPEEMPQFRPWETSEKIRELLRLKIPPIKDPQIGA